MPTGLKGYLENPDAILAFRPNHCADCGFIGPWHLHGRRERYTSLDGEWLRIDVFRYRCPQCRATTTLLPDCLLPYRQHSLATIAEGIEAYLTTPRSYRQVAATTPLPVGESLSTFGSHPAAPIPAASTLCRWVHQFADSALAWWPLLLAALQHRTILAVRPPAEPEWLAAKAAAPERRTVLTAAWGVLWLLAQLLKLLGQAASRWPQALIWADLRPSALDHTGWFLRRTPVPP